MAGLPWRLGRGFQSVLHTPINRTRGEHHDRYLHLRRLFQPRRLRRRHAATGAATGASKAPSCSTTASPCTAQEQRMVFGANTYRAFAQMLASSTEESEVRDPWVTRMRSLPATVVSTTLEGPLDWPDATVVSGDAVDVVARLKEESEVPLRSHGSLSMNRALMAAGLVDRVQVTLFPVITGQTGAGPDLRGCGRLRPRADREPDARRQHPRAHLPAHPACLSPSMHPTPSSSRTCPRLLCPEMSAAAKPGPAPGLYLCAARPAAPRRHKEQRS